MIEAWRLVKARYADTAFSGEGARLGGGRWNSVGTAMVYTAGSLALAELEVLAHVPSRRILGAYVAFCVRFAEESMEVLPPERLPEDWRGDPAPRSTKNLGDAWVHAGGRLVLRVPSAVVPREWNYLLNPAHPALTMLQIEGPFDPELDPRLGAG